MQIWGVVFGTMQIVVGLFLETMQIILGQVGNNANIGRLGKKKNMCVSCYISKQIRVGRSLLIFFFPDFTKKHNRCVVCTKYITKRGLFGLFTYNTECMSYCKGIS